MKKDTLTFERKLYTAPVCKTHVLQIEEDIMSGDGWDDNPYNPGWGGEGDDNGME